MNPKRNDERIDDFPKAEDPSAGILVLHHKFREILTLPFMQTIVPTILGVQIPSFCRYLIKGMLIDQNEVSLRDEIIVTVQGRGPFNYPILFFKQHEIFPQYLIYHFSELCINRNVSWGLTANTTTRDSIDLILFGKVEIPL